MVPDSALAHLSDEKYLIYRAKEQQETDPCAAKCWLITAQVLFPKNFGIQFEIYQIEKSANNVRECAVSLASMFKEFKHEIVLNKEIDAILSAVQLSSSQDSETSFLVQLFNLLLKDVQKAIIISSAERTQDTMTHCSLLLLLTSQFPETMAQYGITLVETLIVSEKHALSPLNPFRKKLICNLLPMLLDTRGLEVRSKILHQLLNKTVEFYIAYITSSCKRLQDFESFIEDPWHDLFHTVQQIGWNLGWDLASELDIVNNREIILKKIQAFVEGARLGGSKRDDDDAREVLYTTLIIFLHALIDYTKRINPELFQDSGSSSSVPMTLLEAFLSSEKESLGILGPKRPRLSIEDDIPLITVSRLKTSSCSTGTTGVGLMSPLPNVGGGSISQALITAIKCWDLLYSHEALKIEFNRILENLSIDKILSGFRTDLLMYKGYRQEAEYELCQALQQLRQSAPLVGSLPLLTLNLKIASVYYNLNNFSGAAEACLEVISNLPSSSDTGLTPHLTMPTASRQQHHLHLLALNRSQCLQFVTTLLIYALRRRIFVEGHYLDLCIGHLITLLQYEWPKYLVIFEEVIDLIRKQGGISYPPFYTYIITPDIIEEFMYLSTHEPTLNLDVIAVTHSARSQRTISTRGADRGSKQDFKIAMKKQMMRSDESAETLIIAFLSSEGKLLHQNLMC